METDALPVRSIGAVKEEQSAIDAARRKAAYDQQQNNSYSYAFQYNDALGNQTQIENLQEYQIYIDKANAKIAADQAALDSKVGKETDDAINRAVGSAYPDAIVPTNFTTPGTPSVTATDPDKTVPPAADNTQSVGPLSSMDAAFFGVGDYNGVVEQTKQGIYDGAVAAVSPIGSTLAGNATGIVGAANFVANTFTSTVNKAFGVITDVLSGKILTDAVTGLMTTAEKTIAMVGQAAYQNVMGFLEGFKTLGNMLNSAANIASDIGQTIKKAASDVKSVLTQDWDKLSWPSINWSRIKSCFDTETFTKMGTSVGNFLGNVKLPVGLSINEIKDLTANLDLKEQLLKQVEDVRNGVTKIGTEALNNLYGQLSAVNNAILSITKLPESLTSMVNGLVNRLDPLKERVANKVILDYIKDGKVVKDGDKEDPNQLTDAEKSLRALAKTGGNNFLKALAKNPATDESGNPEFINYQSWNGMGQQSRLDYYESLSPENKQKFVDYINQNPTKGAQGSTKFFP